jgi:hypothetical protein
LRTVKCKSKHSFIPSRERVDELSIGCLGDRRTNNNSTGIIVLFVDTGQLVRVIGTKEKLRNLALVPKLVGPVSYLAHKGVQIDSRQRVSDNILVK